MVYRGKPSLGCHACRARKTKCDQLRPGCSQCKRAKRECTGYRAHGDLIFRDETAKVERKLKAQTSFSVNDLDTFTKRTKKIYASDGKTKTEKRKEECAIIKFLPPTIEDRAVGLFISNYATCMSHPSRGHMEYLEEISRIGILGKGLTAAMTAVGLAVFAHRANAPSLLIKARSQYILAVQFTNKALKDPVDVKKDSTLVGIIVLGIYETIIGKKAGSPRDWIEHFNGAAEVMRLRGSEQLKCITGIRILVTVCLNLLIAGIQHGIELPKHLRDYMNIAYLAAQRQNSDPAFHILHTMMRFATLRADFLQNGISDYEIIERAIELDDTLIEISISHPPTWKYEIVKTNMHPSFVFQGQYHKYHDFWVAQVWNMLRTLRILINEMMCDALERIICKSDSAIYVTQLKESSGTLRELQLDILYSVPQHLGIFPSRDTLMLSPNDHGFKTPMSGSWYLLWPLWLTALLDNATPEIKTFAVRNLRNISSIGGIREGTVLADSLERSKIDKKLDLWNRINAVSQLNPRKKGSHTLI